MMGSFLDALTKEWPQVEQLSGDMPVPQDPQHQDFKTRIANVGETPGDVEDRRSEPESGYNHMRANIDFVGAAARHFNPWLKDLDFKSPQPRSAPRQAGHLAEDAGYYDIPRKR